MEDEYKYALIIASLPLNFRSIYNTAFQWRASRFLMTEAESFWNVKNDNKEVTDDVASFMAKVICTAGGKQEYLSPIASDNNNLPPPENNETPR